MNSHSVQLKTSPQFIQISLLLLFSLLIANISWANSSDWGLVQRFQTQLEQAQSGKVKAMYEVGRMYERGRGTGKSFDAAASWYQKASDAGNDSAKARLGKMYIEGRGVTKDLNKAYQLLSEAARNNVSSAQYQLGIMYEIGIGISENNSKALYWYKKAAELGHYQAERKAKKLATVSSTPYIEAPASAPAKPKTKLQPKTVAQKPAAKAVPNNLIETIASGSWQRRDKPAGYLPSSINNCKKTNASTLICISAEQERNTGSELISFNTEATISSKGGKKFIIEYINNVLEVELVENENISGVEGDDEATSNATRKNAIHKGKQEKVHHLDCNLGNSKTITCIKNSTRTLEFKS